MKTRDNTRGKVGPGVLRCLCPCVYLGSIVGCEDGASDGDSVGWAEGSIVGCPEGRSDG